jgi:methyl-accepting chemotaxis protein
MTTNRTNQNTQSLTNQLSDLLDEAKKVNQDIDETNKEAREEINDLEVKVGDSVNKVEQIYSDLDQIEKDAGDELDKLVLQHSEDLAAE